jgi:hypothetical protein
MDDFKQSAKMQCFKEGGSVKYKSRHSEKSEMSEDVSKDKKIVKKAFAMHDKQEHPGKKTNLSKLRNGGRAKKDCGTVKKYRAGGSVENAYGTPKTDKDLKDIANTKRQKPKKMQEGRLSGPVTGAGLGAAAAPSAAIGKMPMTELEKRRMMEKMQRAKMLDPAQQSELIKQSPAAAGLVPPPAGKYQKGGSAKKC